MASKSQNWWPAYIVLLLIVAVRFLPLIVGTEWLWGVGQLTLLPTSYVLTYALVGALILALPWLPSSERWGAVLVAWFSRVFFESRSKYYARGAVVVVAGIVFALNRMPTHFLGDGYSYLANIGSESGYFVKWSEAGAMKVIMGVQVLLGPKNEVTALEAFQIVSIVSGIVTLSCYFVIAQVLTADPLKRFITVLLLTTSSTLLMFFGYVESYPVFWVPVAGFLYFGIRYAIEGKGLLGALVCLLVATILHLQAGMYWPAAMYLVLYRGRGLEIYKKYRLPVWGLVGAIAIAFVVLLVREFRSNLAFENIFLFSIKPMYPDYILFSRRHLADLINLLLLVYPLGIILVTLFGNGVSKRLKDPASVFLGLLSVGSLLFLLLIDPGLSMPRDWDLFALCWFTPTVWLLYLIGERQSEKLQRFALPIGLGSLLCVLPFLLVNLDEQRGIQEIRQIAADNRDKSFGTLTILANYYSRRGELKVVDSMGRQMRQEYPDFYRIKDAFAILAEGRQNEAYRLFVQARPDRFSKDYHSFLSAYNLRLGNADAALQYAKNAIQLQVYFDRSYALLAYAYMMKGEPEEAVKALRNGYALNQKNKEFIVGLAQINFNGRHFDSTLYYAEKLRQVDSTDMVYYYLAAKGFSGTGDMGNAYQSAEFYLERGGAGSGYQANSQELKKLLPNMPILRTDSAGVRQ